MKKMIAIITLILGLNLQAIEMTAAPTIFTVGALKAVLASVLMPLASSGITSGAAGAGDHKLERRFAELQGESLDFLASGAQVAPEGLKERYQALKNAIVETKLPDEDEHHPSPGEEGDGDISDRELAALIIETSLQ